MRENTYFGEPWNVGIATNMERTPTPVDTRCLFCAEAIEEGDQGLMIGDGNDGQRPVHQECLIRMVGGPVAHHQGRCSCYGGVDHDPPGLTRREAAREAAAFWQGQHWACENDTVLEGDGDA